MSAGQQMLPELEHLPYASLLLAQGSVSCYQLLKQHFKGALQGGMAAS